MTLILMVFCLTGSLAAYEDKEEQEQSLEDLLNTKIDTAAKYKQYIHEAPASITVITAEEIARFGYRSLEEAFMSVPGFYVSDDRNYSYIGTRGFGRPTDYNNRLLLLINGHSMNEGYYGGAAMGSDLSLNMKMIERIEIVRGPGSALYGTGAMFGVVNIITKKGGQSDNLDVTVEGGSYGRLEGGLTYGNKLKNGLDVFVSGQLRNVNGQDLYFAEFDDPETNNGRAEGIDWDRSFGLQAEISLNNFTLHGTAFGRNKGVPTAPWDVDFNDDDSKTWDVQGFLELKYSRKFSEDKDLMVRGFYNNYAYKGWFPYLGSMEWDKNDVQWAGGEATFTWDLSSNNRLILGTEYQDHFRAYYKYWAEEETYLEHDYPFQVFSLFAQDEFQITPEFSLVAGVRHDEYSSVGSATSPRLAVVLHPFKSSTIKALYGEAFRAPSPYEAYYDDPISGYKPNPALRPEKIRTFEIGWDQKITRYLLGYATVFNYRMKDLIDWDIDPVDEFYQAMNINSVSASGVEAGFHFKTKEGLLAYGNYTYQATKDVDTQLRLTNSPTHMLKAGFSIPLLGHYFFSSQARYETERITVFETRTDPFLLINLSVTTNSLFKHVRAGLYIRNLFDVDYSYPGGWEHYQDRIFQNGREISFRIEYLF